MALDLANFQSSVEEATMRGGDASGTIKWLVTLLADLVSRNGCGDEGIMTKVNRSSTLPGFYETITEWDFIVMRHGHLIAVIRLDAVPRSAEDNEHQRTAEAVYAAHALQAAYRCGTFGEEAHRPFIGWLLIFDDDSGPGSFITEDSPHFPLRSEFQDGFRLQHHQRLCRKLMQENLYTAASVINFPAAAARNGRFTDVSEMTGLRNFVSAFAGHIAAEAAR